MKRRSISTWSRAKMTDKSHYSPTPKLFPGSFLVYAFCRQKWSERLRFSTTFLKLESWFFAKNFEAFTSNKHLFLNQSQYDRQITLLAHSKTIFQQFMPFAGEVLRFSTKILKLEGCFFENEILFREAFEVFTLHWRSISIWSRANMTDKPQYSPPQNSFPAVYAFCKQK